MKKLNKSYLVAVSIITSFAVVFFLGCNNEEETPPKLPGSQVHEHSWTVTDTTQQTCGEAARTYYSCECGATKTVRGTAATGQHNFSGHVCDDCGYVDTDGMEADEAVAEYGFYYVDADESSTYTTNDKVYFGSYPQTLVNPQDLNSEIPEDEADGAEADEEAVALTENLNNLITVPSADDDNGWTAFDYYDAGVVKAYMYYQDVEFEGCKYRGVYLLNYRPTDSSYKAAGAANSYTDEQGYELETVYWFKFTPMEWVVLDFIGGELLLNSNYCVEAQAFNNTYALNADKECVHTDDDSTYVSDWESSSLRSFLNKDFIELAFSAAEAALIGEATLDNKTTGYTIDSPYQTMQKSTTDKVFLLSAQDMMNTDYGFPATIDYDSQIDRGGTDPDDPSVSESLPRRRNFTAYALIQGMRPSAVAHTAEGNPTCWYTLRSSGNMSYSICGITKYGSVQYKGASGNPADSVNAIVPSLYLNVKNLSEAK